MDKKIVFCGGGNMAEGILGGFINNGGVSPKNIAVSEVVPARCEYLKETYGIEAAGDVKDQMAAADVILIAVTPQHLESVTGTLRPLVNENQIIISIVAATPLAKLADQLGQGLKLVRMTPNTLIKTQCGYSALCMSGGLTEDDRAIVRELVGYLGQILEIREDMFDAFTSFTNVGPLWIYETIQALTDAGVYVGFRRKDALDMVLKNMMGAAMLIGETGADPGARAQAMMSPGGVTIEAERSLKKGGFQSILMESVIAGYNKTKNL